MTRPSLSRRIVAGIGVTLALMAAPAKAQSVLRDAETEALFRDMAAPLVRAAGMNPSDVRLVLIGEADADGNFHAKDMLLKCPSKYNEENKVTTAGI